MDARRNLALELAVKVVNTGSATDWDGERTLRVADKFLAFLTDRGRNKRMIDAILDRDLVPVPE